MMKFCFMTSHGYSIPGGLGLPHELSNLEILKSNRSYLMNPGAKQEIIPASSFKLNPEHLEPWKPVSSLNRSSQFVELDSAMMRPLLMDVHGKDKAPESLVLSFGIAEKYARQEKVMEFLLSRSEEFKERGFDMSMLSELMELEAMKSSSQLLPHGASSVLYLNQELEKPVLDLVRDMMDNPEFSLKPNGHLLFSSSSNAELNDILSVASEFSLLRESTKWRQLSPLIPHFQRFGSEVLTPVTVLAPLKSPEKTSLKPSPKKQNTKRKAKERDLYKRNHLHAYESLLSLMIGNDHQDKQTTVLTLQRSCGELSELLTQFSITAAGTGMAVLFSVVCSIASRRVPFCANKFFDTGLGFSLVILSWAVNRLREVIVHVNRKANKPSSSLKGDEIMNNVERSIKEVYFRAATVLAVFALRFAC
ncbi:hypothetical protein N665_1436s0008 [Sinapis alba]|nr:hypothetical protein N665_1436s0008 [Sinapis alba]